MEQVGSVYIELVVASGIFKVKLKKIQFTNDFVYSLIIIIGAVLEQINQFLHLFNYIVDYSDSEEPISMAQYPIFVKFLQFTHLLLEIPLLFL